MKKTLIAVLAAFLLSAQGFLSYAGSPGTFGIVGGFTSSATNVKDFSQKNVSQYHLGIAGKLSLPLGFAIQPELIYHVKGAKLEDLTVNGVSISSFDTKVGFLEVPVQFQWGPDLLAFRPYIFAEPFVGIGVNSESTRNVLNETIQVKSFDDSNLNRLEYGLGLGAGIEFWHLQLSARYFWNFGSLYKEGETADETAKKVSDTVKAAFENNKSFNGITVSLALMF